MQLAGGVFALFLDFVSVQALAMSRPFSGSGEPDIICGSP